MPELARAIQAALLTAAATVHVWRDAAIVLLGLLVIACLWLWVEGNAA